MSKAKKRDERRNARAKDATKSGEKKAVGRPTGKRNRAQELYISKHRPFIDNMLDTGSSSKSILDYLRSRGFMTSQDLVLQYKRKREAAIRYKGFAAYDDYGPHAPDYAKLKRIDDETKRKLQNEYMQRYAEEDTLSDRDKEIATDLGTYRRTASQQMNALARHRRKKHRNNKQKVMTDLQFLDVLIQKGIETLAQMPSIDPGKALKAIELKHKLTDGKHGGVTMYGMEEIRLRENAREAAMVETIAKFVPEDQQEALLAQLDVTSSEFYRQHGLEDLYDRDGEVADIEAYLEEEGMEPDEDDSYYTEDEEKAGD